MESKKKEEQIQKNEEKKIKTDIDQEKTEAKVLEIFEKLGFNTKSSKEYKGEAKFYSDIHYKAYRSFFDGLGPENWIFENKYPLLLYFVINDILMLKDHCEIDYELKIKIVEFLKDFQHEDGGFRGSPKGEAEIVSTYAGVMAIVNLGIPEAYDIIDIPKMKNYLLRLKNNIFEKKESTSFDKNGKFLIDIEKKDGKTLYHTAYPGSFQTYVNGGSDIQAIYRALIVASILNLINFDDIENDPITKGVVEHIKNSQNYEGGLGPEPFCEAHAGFTYCGVASLVLLKKLNVLDVNALLRFLVNRQMTKEGGFNGRTNKLVDCCYSFWAGCVFNLLAMSDKKYYFENELLYDQLSLQAYILLACQNVEFGGLRDKPGCFSDLTHSNFGTVGLMSSQECLTENQNVVLNPELAKAFVYVNPVYGIPQDKLEKALRYYAEKKIN